eukprot:1154832-Pelagomonas_calceolata.AAC.1
MHTYSDKTVKLVGHDCDCHWNALLNSKIELLPQKDLRADNNACLSSCLIAGEHCPCDPLDGGLHWTHGCLRANNTYDYCACNCANLSYLKPCKSSLTGLVPGHSQLILLQPPLAAKPDLQVQQERQILIEGEACSLQILTFPVLCMLSNVFGEALPQSNHRAALSKCLAGNHSTGRSHGSQVPGHAVKAAEWDRASC